MYYLDKINNKSKIFKKIENFETPFNSLITKVKRSIYDTTKSLVVLTLTMIKADYSIPLEKFSYKYYRSLVSYHKIQPTTEVLLKEEKFSIFY